MVGEGVVGWEGGMNRFIQPTQITRTLLHPPPPQPPTHPQVMQKLWLSVSGMTEKIIFTSVNPILEQYRPAIFNQVHSPLLSSLGRSICLFFYVCATKSPLFFRSSAYLSFLSYKCVSKSPLFFGSIYLSICRFFLARHHQPGVEGQVGSPLFSFLFWGLYP